MGVMQRDASFYKLSDCAAPDAHVAPYHSCPGRSTMPPCLPRWTYRKIRRPPATAGSSATTLRCRQRRPPRWVCGKPPHPQWPPGLPDIWDGAWPCTGTTQLHRRGATNRLVAAALDERAELIASPATNSAPADGPGAPACLALADTAPCPVLAVPLTGRWRPTAGGSTICGIDGSDRSATAARTAARLAMALGTRLELVHVVTPPKNRADHGGDPRGAFRDFLWRALRTLDAMPPVDLVLDVGDPARRLRTFAESDPRCS